MKQLNAIIVDDEPAARENLQALLEAYCPEVHVIADCGDVRSAYQCILGHTAFDVLFLDINLGKETGFDLLELIPDRKDFHIVFVTAYDQYALKAFNAEAIDYLLKPVSRDALTKCIGKIRRLGNSHNAVPESLLQALQTVRRQETKKILVPGREGSDIVAAALILYIQAEGSYTRIRLEDGRELYSSRNLKHYEGLLEETGLFIRVHKSYIANKEHIIRLVKTQPARIILSNEVAIPISDQMKDIVYGFFG